MQQSESSAVQTKGWQVGMMERSASKATFWSKLTHWLGCIYFIFDWLYWKAMPFLYPNTDLTSWNVCTLTPQEIQGSSSLLALSAQKHHVAMQRRVACVRRELLTGAGWRILTASPSATLRQLLFSQWQKTSGELSHLCFAIPLGLGIINMQTGLKIFKNTSKNAQP